MIYKKSLVRKHAQRPKTFLNRILVYLDLETISVLSLAHVVLIPDVFYKETSIWINNRSYLSAWFHSHVDAIELFVNPPPNIHQNNRFSKRRAIDKDKLDSLPFKVSFLWGNYPKQIFSFIAMFALSSPLPDKICKLTHFFLSRLFRMVIQLPYRFEINLFFDLWK